MKNNVLIIVQCRFNSKRLHGKALYPLSGLPILSFLLRRLKAGLLEEEYSIVLATSERQQDDIVASWGLEEGIPVFRGDEDDVLKRYVDCLDRYPSNMVVRVTADNPLTCPESIERLVMIMKSENADYAQCNNIPCGAGADAFSSGVLIYMAQEVKELDEREHINLHLLRNKDKFKIYFLNMEGELARPDLRMTVDTREDWQRLQSLFNTADEEPWKISLHEIIKRMDKKLI
jgi:spore coat polysaccharide biosynthesis protein SpsF